MGLADNMRGPLYPEILKEFNLDNTQGGLFFSIASFMVIPGGYITGFFLDSWGRRRTLRCAVLMMTASLMGFWLATSFMWILAFVFFFGIALGSMGVVQNVTVIEAAPANEPEKLQKFQAGLHSMYGLSSLAAPAVVILVRHFSTSWRTPFLFAAILGFLLLGLSYLIPQAPPTAQIPESDLKDPLRRQAIYFGFILASYVGLEVLLTTHIAQFARMAAGWSFAATNQLNLLFFLGMFAGRFLFVFWHPPLQLRWQLCLSLLGSSACVIFGVWLHPSFLALAGLAAAPFYPMGMTLAGKMFPRSLGLVTSNAIGFSGITVVLMQTLVGVIGDHQGLASAMLVGPLFAFIAFLMILGFPFVFGKKLDFS